MVAVMKQTEEQQERINRMTKTLTQEVFKDALSGLRVLL